MQLCVDSQSRNVTFAYCTKGCIDVAVLRGRPLTHVSSLSRMSVNTHPIRQIFLGRIPNIEDRVCRLHTRAMGLWDSLIFGKKSTIKMDTWEGYGIVPQVLSKRSYRCRFRCCSFLFRRSSDGDRHQENGLQKPCFSTSHGTDSHLKITGRPRICWSSWTRRAVESKFDVGFREIETVQHCSWFVGSCTRRGPPTSILAARRVSPGSISDRPQLCRDSLNK